MHKSTLILLVIAGAGSLPACTYDGIRMQERSQCAAMPQTQAQRCYHRTRLTRAEYEAERNKLRRSQEASQTRGSDELDPRYEKWVP